MSLSSESENTNLTSSNKNIPYSEQYSTEIYARFKTVKERIEPFDIFLVHASEDKKRFVNELYTELTNKHKLRVFKDDEYTRGKGDYIHVIQDALRVSKYGLFFISPNFLKKYKFGEDISRECNYFFDREKRLGRPIMLPVLYGIHRGELGKLIPYLATYWNIEVSEVRENKIKEKTPSEVAGEVFVEIQNREEKLMVMRLRKATVSDIPKIQAVEEDFYDGFKLPEEILRDWIENLSENFIVAEEDGKLAGCIFWEQLKEIKAIPYFHQSKDYHRPNGEYFYISEVGVLNKNPDLLQRLFDMVVKEAKKKNIKAIIWVTGMDEKGHDAMERNLLEKNEFRKLKKVKHWEYSPGKFSEKHWIFVKEL